MSTGYTIHVTGISPETTEAKLNDFFSFCGKLISVTKTEKSAVLVFEKESASKTALMLSGGTLDGAHLEVTSAAPIAPTQTLPAGVSGSTPIGAKVDAEGHVIEQEDKPKAGIVAEYLAHGYILGDHIVQRAIEVDQKQGISHKFLSYIDNLDKKVGAKVVGPEQTVSGKLTEHLYTALDKTKEVDQNRGISRKTGDYYSKAIGTSVGQKVHSFYTTTSKQVIDVHEEAKRIAAAKKAASSPATPTSAETPILATDVATSSTAFPATAPVPATTTTTSTTSPIASATATATSIGHAVLGKIETLTGTGAAVPGGTPLSTQLGQAVESAKAAVGNATSSTQVTAAPTAPTTTAL